MTLAATYYGANGWLLEFDDLRVLVDPWLRGSLSFPPGEWLLKGELPCERKVPEIIWFHRFTTLILNELPKPLREYVVRQWDLTYPEFLFKTTPDIGTIMWEGMRD